MEPSEAQPESKRRIPKWLIPAIGYSIALASLYYVFHNFDFKQMQQDVRTLHWGWVLLGILLNLSVYIFDAWRWGVILSPAEEAPLWECVRAVFIGQVANAVLPAKAGEVVRCYLLSFWTDSPFSLALTADAIGRVMDGACLVLGFYLFTWGIADMPRALREGAFFFSIGVIVLCLLLALVLFRREHAKNFVSGNKWVAKFAKVMHEIHTLGDHRTLRNASFISILYLLMPVLSIWALFRAYNFDFSFVSAAVALVIIHLGTTLPGAPANAGTFSSFAVLSLTMMGAGPAEAKIFSVFVYFAHTVPPILVGLAVLVLSGVNLGQVHTHAKVAHHAPVA